MLCSTLHLALVYRCWFANNCESRIQCCILVQTDSCHRALSAACHDRGQLNAACSTKRTDHLTTSPSQHFTKFTCHCHKRQASALRHLERSDTRYHRLNLASSRGDWSTDASSPAS